MNDIFIMFIGSIGISHTMKTNSPLSRLIRHLEPNIGSIVKPILNFDSISWAFNRLIIGPVASKLNFVFSFWKLNKTFFIKIFRWNRKLTKKRMYLNIFVNIMFQMFTYFMSFVCTEDKSVWFFYKTMNHYILLT